MKNRVLIISADFFDYQNSVARAFDKLGYQSKVVTYDEPIHPFKGITKWRHKFTKNKEALKKTSRDNYKNYIHDVFDKYKPQLVFIYNGTILYDDTLDYFRSNGAKVILWMYDSVLRSDRTMCISHIDHVDLFCCFEESDVEYYKKQGKLAYFVPLACDSTVYFPIENTEKDIDILFVGTIYISEKRIKILENLAAKYPDKTLCFYGYYKPYFKNPFSCFTIKNRNVFKNKNITPSKVNELYSKSKIALNIHNQQTFNGANQRLFEASGAGVYQICDRNPFIENLFENGEIGLYDDFDQLCSLIDYALNNDMRHKANKAYEVIVNNHTFERRIQYMLSLLK